MNTKIEIVGIIHEVVMGFYDESIPFENIELDKIVEDIETTHFFKKMLLNPEQTSIFAENENYIIASAKVNDLDANVSRLEALNEPLSITVREELKAALHDNIPRFPENPESRYIGCFVAEYPNVKSSFEINNAKFDSKKLSYSKSGFNTLVDIVLSTMDYFQFLNTAVYDGEIIEIDIDIGKPSELRYLDFFIYDTKMKKRVYERTWKLI